MRYLTSLWMQFWFTPKSPTPFSLFRILFGFIVIECLCVHYAADFYLLFGDRAMLPIEAIANVNWRQEPILDLMLLLPPGDPWKLAAFVALCGFSFALMLGLFTRLSAFVLMVGIISLHHHSGWCFNAGDNYMILALMLLSMSNAGDAFSIDSIARVMNEDWRILGFKPPPSAPCAQRMLQINLALV